MSTPDYDLPAPPAYEGPTYYVSASSSSGPSTNPSSRGGLQQTIQGVNDGAIIVCAPGAYAGFTTVPKSGQQGRIKIIGENPVFTDIDTSSIDGTLTGYNPAGSFARLSGAVTLDNFGGIWVEGFRLGTTSAGATNARFLIGHRSGTTGWYVRNYHYNVYTQQCVHDGPGSVVCYQNYHTADGYEMYGVADYTSDYGVFATNLNSIWVAQSIFRGVMSKPVSLKQNILNGYVYDNVFDCDDVVSGHSAAYMVLFGQVSDAEVKDNTIGYARAAYNKLRIGSTGVMFMSSNVSEAMIEENTLIRTGGKPYALMMDAIDEKYNDGSTLHNCCQRNSRHPKLTTFQNNIIQGGADNLRWAMGKTWVKATAPDGRTRLHVEQNTVVGGGTIAPVAWSASFPDGQGSFAVRGANSQHTGDEPIVPTFGTNSGLAPTGKTSTLDSFTYTVADDYSTTTATVTVTIEGAGVSFVTASADSVETLKGTAVEIDVIANDTASADNLPLVVQTGSITAPSPSGTAKLQPSGKILYTPVSGFTGDVSFNYTAKPSGKASPTSTAACSVRVVDVSTGTPKIPPEPTTVAKIRTVGYAGPAGSTRYDTISAALAAANPGDHVFLDDKDWGIADLNVTQSGTAGNHIVIRSRTHKGAILRGTCIGRGDYLWWYGLTVAHPPVDPSSIIGANNTVYECPEIYSLVMFGHHQNVTRCNIRSSNGIWIHETSNASDALGLPNFKTHDIAVAYNTFANDMTGVWGPHVNIYMGRYPGNSSGPYNIEVAYNLVSDLVANPNGANTAYWVYTGNSKPLNNRTGNEARNEFHHNLVDTSKTAALYLKRGANVRYNYLRCTGANDQCLNLRHGGRSSQDGETVYTDVPTCYVEGNLFDDGGIKVSDTDWVIRFNRFNSGYKDIQLMCGQARNIKNDGQAQSAKRTILVGNGGVNKYVLGFLQPNFHLDAAEGGRVKGVKIYRAGETITATNITAAQVEPGAAGYEILDGQPAGTPSITPITKAALTAVCGCDK